jgi:tetratricopeptide (TPR) repeat protein
MPIITHYQVLGVKDDSTTEEIAAAYRKKIKQWHPDICRLPEAEERMRDLNKAAEVLLNPAKRNNYDKFLAGEASLFRKAISRALKDQPEHARPLVSDYGGSGSEPVKKRRTGSYKGPRIQHNAIRSAAGFCAAVLVLVMLVVAGLITITSPNLPGGGISSPSFSPPPVSTAITSVSAQPAIEQGNELFEAGDYEGALRLYDTAIAGNPDLAQKEVWYNRGIAQAVLGHYTAASQSFDRVLALSPDDSLALAQKGAALIGLGRYEESLQYTDRALAGYSDAAWIRNIRAIALLNLMQQNEGRAASDNPLVFPTRRSVY